MDYKRIQALGSWLNRLLADPLENWDLIELFEDAVILLGLHYEIPYDHPFFVDLDKMTKSNRNWQQVSFILNPNGIGIHSNPDEHVGPRTRKELSLTINQVQSILRIIDKNRCPWHSCINDIFEGKWLEPTKQEMERLICSEGCDGSDIRKSIRNARQTEILNIDHLYSKIGDKILTTDNGCKRVKVFISCDRNKVSSETTTPLDQTMPFAIIIARVFFDFLLLGGQEYYSFCKNCGCFIVVQRKARRKFCSGRCRIAYKRMMDQKG